MTPDDALIRRVAETGLLGPDVAPVVLLSGGRDSVALLDLATEICGAGRVRALHCNYRLRDDESEEDERLCVRLCDGLGVALSIERPKRPEGGGNLHAWARDARYALGLSLCEAQPGGRLLTAHTASDQVETVLYRLATSPGRRALLGMPARSGLLARPLLAAGVTRAETTAWCRQRGLSWRDDSSNSDDRFARTRVREGLVAAFLKVDPRAEGAILQTVAALGDEAAALDAIVDEVLGQDKTSVDRERLAQLPAGLGRLVLRQMAEVATGAPCPRAATRLAEVLELRSGAIDLGDGARAVVRGDKVRIGPTPPLPGR